MSRPRMALLGAALLTLYACSDQPDQSAPLVPSQASLRQDPAEVKEHKGRKVPGQYIIVLNDDADAAAVAARNDTERLFTYGSVIKGFAAKLSPGQLQKLRRDAAVKYIEEDGYASIAQGGAPPSAGGPVAQGPRDGAGIQSFQVSPPWGLCKLDEYFGGPGDSFYDYTPTGKGVRAYVLDTGINTGHNDFDGAALNRAKAGSVGFDAFGGSGQDCNGHGTHVTGTIIGTTYGVAKAATAYSVRVLDCAGFGAWSGIIAGIDWVANSHVKPAVANMSLGGGRVQAVNDAVAAAVRYGVTFVVAAGNNGVDAVNNSPASEPTAITVAASDINNARAWFSAFGPLVDLYAPGVGVLSAWIGSTTATNTIDGTSMASPHVAGIAALYLEGNKTAGPGQVADVIEDMTVPNVITGNPGGTPNRLAHFLGLWYLEANSSAFPIDNSSFGSGFEYYYSGSSGFHHAWLRGQAAIDFDLVLERWNGTAWVAVKSMLGSSNNEYLVYSGTPAYYRYIVKNANTTTAGSYDFFYQRPL
jgi:aqualysin 1